MLLEVGIIAAGIPLGWLLRKKRAAQKTVSRLLTGAVWGLLFLLGFALGGDKALMAQLDQLGVQAAVISIFSVLGTLLVARLLGAFLHMDGTGGADTQNAPGGPDTEEASSHPYGKVKS